MDCFFFSLCFLERFQLAPKIKPSLHNEDDFLFFIYVFFCLWLQLAPIKLSRYSEDLLFYLYYTNGGDILQLAAAAEL